LAGFVASFCPAGFDVAVLFVEAVLWCIGCFLSAGLEAEVLAEALIVFCSVFAGAFFSAGFCGVWANIMLLNNTATAIIISFFIFFSFNGST
jgi:hypothetical protein